MQQLLGWGLAGGEAVLEAGSAGVLLSSGKPASSAGSGG